MTKPEIERILRPYILNGSSIPGGIYGQLSQYLELLLKWNSRTNLTAIRDPEEIVRRHFGESLFAAQHLGDCQTLLDFGSGAGFPGLPIQLMRPDIRVTLAESQNKKATFLREVIRTLGLKTEVWAARVETMPSSQRFDIVTLRAVDNMEAAIAAAAPRAERRMMLLTTANNAPDPPTSFAAAESIQMPGTDSQQVLVFTRQS